MKTRPINKGPHARSPFARAVAFLAGVFAKSPEGKRPSPHTKAEIMRRVCAVNARLVTHTDASGFAGGILGLAWRMRPRNIAPGGLFAYKSSKVMQ